MYFSRQFAKGLAEGINNPNPKPMSEESFRRLEEISRRNFPDEDDD